MEKEAQQEDNNLMKRMFENWDDEATCKCQPIIGQIPNKNQDAHSGHQWLMADYVDDDVVYSSSNFEHQFWVVKHIFFCLCNDFQTKNQDVYFIQNRVSF